MKKRFLLLVCAVVFLITASALFFSGCSSGDGDDESQDDTKEYTIQYTDDAGVHNLTVTNGMPYSIDVIPTKTGYDFAGLFDAEVGGTRYVSANGSSLAPFSDRKNLVLFPQFTPKEYTVILDYRSAPVTGSRRHTVTYGTDLPELPKNLTLEHKIFKGWYTEPDCGGVQIADEQGLIPIVSVLNERNFEMKGEEITIYAGFETEKHKVTFCFEAGMDTEEMQVEYGTPIKNVVPTTRVDGKAVLTWSKTEGGEVFTGNITGETVLYAVEYAPVITFDTDGGKSLTPLVARAGSTVALPTPTKDLAKFTRWEDMSGNEYNSTAMPSSSIVLKAIWQAKLVFDENGGSSVDDISEYAGNKITLPVPTKEDYIFAGWYTADKEQYTSTTMPAAGVSLKAGWYKAKEKSVELLDSYAEMTWATGWDIRKPTMEHNSDFEIKIDDIANGKPINVSIDFNIKIKGNSMTKPNGVYYNIYSQKQATDSYLLKTAKLGEAEFDYKKFSFSANLSVSENFYVVFYCSRDAYTWATDCYYTLHYPDTSNLYL